MNIVYANTINYNHPLQQRPHHIMNILADRGHNVYWINEQPNLNQPTFYQEKNHPNVTVYNNFKIFLKHLAMKDIKIDVHFISWAKRYEDIKHIPSKIVAYDSLDLFEQNERWENEMIGHADVVFATTKEIYDYQCKNIQSSNVCKSQVLTLPTIVENGCFSNVKEYDWSVPKEFESKAKEMKLLFSGALSITDGGWVDRNIVGQVSKQYGMTLVGIPWGVEKISWEIFKKATNNRVVDCGVKSYLDLQSYYAHCDVNLLPFKRCQTADYSSPLKIVEGCSHGKPCVATDIPVAIEMSKKYPNAVFVAKSVKEYLQLIEKVYKIKNNPEVISDCYQLALDNDWDRKVDTIESEFNGAIKKKELTWTIKR